MNLCKKVSGVLVIIGALNWGLIGINQGWNVVEFLSGGIGWIEKVVYILVGLSALVLIFGKKCSIMKKEEGKEETMETESAPGVDVQM